jgi:Uncharacterized protein conserved in bacteria (DUF2330)
MIVWDAKSKTEHFVRQANFETNAKDFGFLVPTPTVPELGEVDGALFPTMTQITQARHVYQERIETVFGFGRPPESDSRDSSQMPTASAAPGPAVEVLHQQEVAGFDASVLRADDPKALTEWLVKNGYEARPALTEWLQWYTDHGWIITAFKLTKTAGPGGRLGTRALRMSFQADRPFYPYREPLDMRNTPGKTRALRVFFLSDRKYEGTIGEKGAWPAATEWANQIPGQSNGLTTRLKLTDSTLATNPDRAGYLTEFLDQSNPRPGTDEVYFRPASDQSPKERPPIIHTYVRVQYWPGPMGGLAVVILPVMLGVGFYTLRSRRRVQTA